MSVYDFDLLLPIGLFFIAVCFYVFPPRKINPWTGYRTKRSMESQKNRDYANKYAALVMMVSSLFLALVILVLRNLHWADRDTVLLTNTILCLPFIFLPILFVERKLKKSVK